MVVATGVRSLRGTDCPTGGAGTEGVVGTEEGMVVLVAVAPASNMGVSPPASVGTRTAFVLLLREDFRVGAGLSVTIREGFSVMHEAQYLE